MVLLGCAHVAQRMYDEDAAFDIEGCFSHDVVVGKCWAGIYGGDSEINDGDVVEESSDGPSALIEASKTSPHYASYVPILLPTDCVAAFQHPPDEHVHLLVGGIVSHFAGVSCSIRLHEDTGIPSASVTSGDTTLICPRC